MVERLGKYEILRTLGRGAMGEVYLAHHPVIGREVAIKTILSSATQGVDAEARFRREATAAGQLNHPNLVTIYDFDRDGEILYLVMEYVKGEDLEELIRERDLTQAQYLEVLAQVCDGLAFAHKAGIIHRDIKPANVRVVREGKRLLAKVMDFGIARTEDSNMTSTGIVMGTVSYMAPEYIQSGKATVQADLWAVGVMLYECLAGRKPFHGENTTTVLFKIVSETPRPLEPAEIHGVSTAVRQVLEKALSKDPTQRFLSAEAFAKALRACKDPAWTGGLDEGLTTVVSRQEAAQVRAEAPVLPPTAAVAPLAAPPTQGVPSQGIPAPGTVLLPTAEPGTVMLPPAPEPGTVMLPPATEPGTVVLPSAAPGTVMLPPPAAPPPVPVPAPVPTRAPAQVPTPAPSQGSRGFLYGGIGLGILVLGLGGWYLFGRPTAPSGEPSVPEAPVVAPPAAVPQEKASAQSSTPEPAKPETLKTEPLKTEPPRTEGTKPGASPQPIKPEAAKPEPLVAAPAPVAKAEPESADEQLQRAEAQLDGDYRSAIATLKALSLSGPGSQRPRVHGAYLTALYRARNIAEFERAYDQAKRMGIGTPHMAKAFPPFRALLGAEVKEKGAGKEGILPRQLLDRILADAPGAK